tara:strand:- start:140 stop:1333 length:1194 start_codon:yes stop_codon:yes gene_type:complete
MAKNTHLEHLEDDIFNQGYAGAKNSINFLKSLEDMLTTGHGGSNTKVTVKWDGAPAIICGKEPQTGFFFVGTKSVFNKTTPKICYNEENIDYHYPTGAINSILKKCLNELSKLPIEGIIQGDLLYTSTPTKIRMCGKPCYRFKPNTITYCVEAETDIGRKVGVSDMGIVFHTTYSGPTILEMNAGYGVDVSGLQGVKEVAVFSSTFENVNGKANLSTTDKTKLKTLIASADRNLRAGQKFLDGIVKETGTFAHNALFKIYFNQVIRENRIPQNAKLMAQGFAEFVEVRYNAEIKKKKTKKAQEDWELRKEKSLSYLNKNMTAMFSGLTGFRNLMDAKLIIINKLNKIDGIGTFLEDENGYRVTSPEGFVAIKEGAALKLVDRLEFSRANFTVAKDWG